MNNLEWYYHIVQKYREGLTRINTKFDEKIKAKAGYKGSAQYEKDIAAIEKGRMGEIAALRADCGSDFDRCLASMSKNAKNRPAVAPTEEQLRLIQLLKLKERVTREDLEHVANSMQECGLALSILEEIAREKEILGFHAGNKGVSDQFVTDAIRSFANNARTILSLDYCGDNGRQLDRCEGAFGAMPTMRSIEKFRVDVEPQGPMDCAGRFGGVPETAYKAFVEAVSD